LLPAPLAARLAVAGLGALSVLAWAPFSWAPLLWLTLAGLYAAVRSAKSPGEAAVFGLCFGLGLYLAGVSWVYISLSVFGGMPAVLAFISTLLFCLLLALFPALAMAVFFRLRGPSAYLNVLLFAALWALADWSRGWVFSGFPWLALGYTQTPGGPLPTPLQGYAPVLGVYGVSALVALLGAVLGEWIGPRSAAAQAKVARPEISCKLTLSALAVLLLSAGFLLSRIEWTAPAGQPLKVSLLQGNIEQDLKWSPARFEDSLRTYYDLALHHPAQLTVLPETALPAYFHQLPENYLRALRQLAGREKNALGVGGEIVIGSVAGSPERYTNSVIALAAEPEQRYDKAHLVPFGEYVPPGFAWAMGWLNIPMSGFTAGSARQAPFAVADQQVAFNICYEDVFGEEIARSLPLATLLINVSNTAWFGRSWAQPQHLQIARMRALETGRPMLRATNTGMTAAIRPDGTLQAALEPFTRGALVVEVQGMSGMTPFAHWKNGAALLLIVLFSLPALVWRRKSR
jgi:apolipoprotein N-acyltransferase